MLLAASHQAHLDDDLYPLRTEVNECQHQQVVQKAPKDDLLAVLDLLPFHLSSGLSAWVSSTQKGMFTKYIKFSDVSAI